MSENNSFDPRDEVSGNDNLIETENFENNDNQQTASESENPAPIFKDEDEAADISYHLKSDEITEKDFSTESADKEETKRTEVYINRNIEEDAAKVKREPVKDKKKRKNAPIAVAVVLCIILSGFTAFGATLLANSMSGTRGTSVIYKSVTPDTSISNTDSTFGKPGTYSTVAEKVASSVVEIRTETVSTSSIFSQYITEGAGSGVIITADGYIITNNHVIEGASTVTVTTTNGTKYPAEVIGYDSESDLAVLKVEATDLTPAVVGDSTKLVVGEEVLAIGNPLGSLGGTVTNGIISALARQVTIDGTEMTLLQTNAAVNPGNSGGGLFNLAGELVGIVNAKSSGSGIEGLGFAIPSNMASQVVEQLINYGYVRGRVSLGITYMDISDSYTAMMYRVNTLGVYILESEYNDALKIGDRVTAVDGNEVTYGNDIKAILKDHVVGDKITLTVVRDGKYVDVEMECYEYVPGKSEEDSKQAQKGGSDSIFASPFSSWFGY